MKKTNRKFWAKKLASQSLAWWYMPIIPALRRLRQED
jgi:hypothetical protein